MERFLFVLKDDGNEGSNNSATLLAKKMKNLGVKISILHLDGSNNVFSVKKKIYKNNRKIYIRSGRLRKKEKIKSLCGFFIGFFSLLSMFLKIKKSKIIINNATLIDIIVACCISRHEVFVFLRENHLPNIILKILEFLNTHDYIKILTNNLAINNKIKSNPILIDNFVDVDVDVDVDLIKSKVKIISIGAIYDLKNQMLLLDIADSLISLSFYDFEIYIYGDIINSDYYENIIYEIKKRNLDGYISYNGFIDNDKIGDIYRDSDIYIQTSKSEGLSRSLMDAMNFNLLCFATNVGDTSRLINNETGFIFCDSELNCVSENIIRFYNRDDEVLCKIKVAKNHIINNFSFNSVMKQLKDNEILLKDG